MNKKAMLDDLIDFVLAIFFLALAVVLVILFTNNDKTETVRIDDTMLALRAAEATTHYFQNERLNNHMDRYQQPLQDQALTTAFADYYHRLYGDQWRIDLYNNSDQDPLMSVTNDRIATKTKATYYLPTAKGYLFINLYTGTPLNEATS